MKVTLRRALLAEQGSLCCYCERTIAERGDPSAPSDDCHIEHLHPKGANPGLTYAWSNLLASCEDESRHGATPSSCGHAKGDETLALHPLVPGCDARLFFGSDGAVRAARASDTDAAHTIDVLGLDRGNPRRLRAAAIEAIVGLLPDPADPDYDAVRLAELTRLAAPDAQGRWSPFVTALCQVLARL